MGISRCAVRLPPVVLAALSVLVALLATIAPSASAQGVRGRSSPAQAHALSALREHSALSATARRAGARRRARARAHAAVVGGAPVSIEQLPWQVAVMAKYEYEGKPFALLCGGSIVRDMSHVLTAGHCAFNPITGEGLPVADLTVVAGVSTISEKELLEGPTMQAREVAAARVHPYFDSTAGAGASDDVAELELAAPLQPSAAVSTVALAATGALPVEGEQATLSGFGEDDSLGEEPNKSLDALDETLGFSRKCGGEANALFICASSPSGSACSGDSGGGLVAGTPRELIGVVDTVAVVAGQHCAPGAMNGFANVTAPEILDFVEGSETPPVAPKGGSAVIRGFVEVGKALTCEPGTWSGSPAYTYAFVSSADGQVLQQGPSSTYALSDADLARQILCEVYATNAGGTGIGRTPALPPIEVARVAATPPLTGAQIAPPAPSSAAEPPPGAGAGVLGSRTKSLSDAQLAALLRKALSPSGKAARLASVTRSGRATVKFSAPQAGSVSITWYQAGARAGSARGARARPLLVAAGHMAFTSAGTGRIAIALTSAGRRALRGRSRILLTARGTFTRAGAAPVEVSRAFTLTR